MRLSNVGLVVAATYLWPTIRDEYQHMNFVCHLPTEVQTKTLNEQEFRDVLVQFGNCTAVERKRHSHSGGYVTLINATPYDWKLTSIVQDEGDSYFPPLIAAGATHEQHVNFNWGNWDAAEIIYSLTGAPSPASFGIKPSNQGQKQISIQYRDTLSSLNNPAGSKLDLGYEKYGSSLFVLSGSGGDSPFISTNPPTDWMQKSLSSIGSKSLRRMAMPGSHNSGMNTLTNRYYGGIKHNTLAQSTGVYNQAENGARYFDIRPVYRGKTFLTGHFSKVMSKHVGGTGTSIVDIINDINRFCRDFPGELIILDVSHDMDIDQGFSRFTPEVWQELYVLLSGLADLWIPPSGDLPHDLSTAPLSTFITPGSRSSILVRLPAYAPIPVATRGASRHDAFLTGGRLPVVNMYSDTDNPKALSKDQIGKMRRERSWPDSYLFVAAWTLTEHWLHNVDITNPRHSIIGDAARARRSLFSELWPALSRETYPNIIQIDDVRNKEVLALAMAINHHFASPPQIARRDVLANETAPSDTPAAEYQKCSLFHKLSPLWILTGNKCQWKDNKVTDEKIIEDDTEPFDTNEEAEVSQVEPTKVEPTGLGASVVLDATKARQTERIATAAEASEDTVIRATGKEQIATSHITKTKPMKSTTAKTKEAKSTATKIEPTTAGQTDTAKGWKEKIAIFHIMKTKPTTSPMVRTKRIRSTATKIKPTKAKLTTTVNPTATVELTATAKPTMTAESIMKAKATKSKIPKVKATKVKATHSPTNEHASIEAIISTPTSEDIDDEDMDYDAEVEAIDSATPAAQAADDEIEAKYGKRAVPFRA